MQALMSGDALLRLALSFPVVLFSVLIGLLAVYWLLVLVRLAPVELFERDSLREDNLASAMISLGFVGVPATITLTLLVLLAWLLTMAIEVLVLQHLDLGLFRVPLGVVILWASLALASPVVAAICRALPRRLHHNPKLPRCLLGERVRVESPEKAGAGVIDAVLEDDAECRVKLRIKAGKQAPTPGECRVLVKYLRGEDAYRSVPEQSFLDARARLVKLKLIERHHRREGGDSSHSDSKHNGNGSTSST